MWKNKDGLCRNCHRTCLTCNKSRKNDDCKTCDALRTLKDGKCTCNEGYE